MATKHQGDPHEFVFKTPEQAHEVFPVLANFLKDKNMVHRLQKYALTRRNSLSMTEADWELLAAKRKTDLSLSSLKYEVPVSERGAMLDTEAALAQLEVVSPDASADFMMRPLQWFVHEDAIPLVRSGDRNALLALMQRTKADPAEQLRLWTLQRLLFAVGSLNVEAAKGAVRAERAQDQGSRLQAAIILLAACASAGTHCPEPDGRSRR